MKYFVLTNNPKVVKEVAPGTEVRFRSCGIVQILEDASLLIASGHTLLSHPLSGSVKPGETPYKSMLISTQTQQGIDRASAQLISNAITACTKFTDKSDTYSAETLDDLQTVDLALVGSAISSANG